eukprot:4424122-Karenia_brevis.AAC.1
MSRTKGQLTMQQNPVACRKVNKGQLTMQQTSDSQKIRMKKGAAHYAANPGGMQKKEGAAHLLANLKK